MGDVTQQATLDSAARNGRPAGAPGYLPHVDGLRALAIVPVVLFHAWPALMPGGFIGVDVFFVISGFLITRLIAHEMDAGTFSFVGFLARRVRRLVPASVVMIGVVLAVGALILLPDTLKSLGHAVVYTSALLANWHFYRTAGYFTAPPEEKPLLHMWSLAVEDQFYLTWPLVLFIMWRWLPWRMIVAAAMVLAAASLWHAQTRLGASQDYAFYMLLPRAWELLAGCVLGLVASRYTLPASGAAVASYAGLLLVAASTVVLNPSIPFPGLSAVPAVAGTLLLIAGGMAGQSAVRRALSWRPVVLIGLISYSLYLWHWPILSMSQYALGRTLGHAETALAVAVSFVLAWASWRYVERPFRKAEHEEWRGALRTVLTGVAALLPIAAVGGAYKIFDGVPRRYDGAAEKIFIDMADGNPLRPSCDGYHLALRNDPICNFGRKLRAGESYDVVVLGDSNADHFVPAVAAWAEAKGHAGRQVTQSACAALLGTRVTGRRASLEEECDRYHRSIVAFVDRNPGLKLAVLGGAWSGYQGRMEPTALTAAGLTPAAAVQPGTPYDFERALARTVDYLIARGIEIHIVAQIPHFGVLPVTCIVRIVQGSREDDAALRACGMPLEGVARRHAGMDEAFRRIAATRPQVSLSFPASLVCRDGACQPYRDGVFLYRNAGHLSHAGALRMREILNLPDLR